MISRETFDRQGAHPVMLFMPMTVNPTIQALTLSSAIWARVQALIQPYRKDEPGPSDSACIHPGHSNQSMHGLPHAPAQRFCEFHARLHHVGLRSGCASHVAGGTAISR